MMIACLCKDVGARLDTFIAVAAYGIRRGCSNFLLEWQPVHAREYVRTCSTLRRLYIYIVPPCFLLSMEWFIIFAR